MMVETPVKSRPFTAYEHEVRAILDNRQTQFRRLITPQPKWIGQGARMQAAGMSALLYYPGGKLCSTADCRFGVPGDLLWVKEAIRFNQEHANAYYVANDKGVGNKVWKRICERDWVRPYLSAIHMPRWASRLWLRVVKVSAERVQEISEVDAFAEGIGENERTALICGGAVRCDWPRWSFRCRWDSLNAKRGFSWDSNPWVWATTFERTEKPA